MQFQAWIAAGCALLFTVAQGTGQEAPDGRRGFGRDARLVDVLTILRASKDADREFVQELDRLASEVDVLASAVRAHYGSRGYLALFDRSTEPTMTGLHALLEEALADPLAALSNGPRGELLARLVADERLRVRARVLAPVEFQVRELRLALAVLRGANDGLVLLSAPEVQNIVVRADLAAAELRAARNDLLALRQAGDEAEVDRKAQALVAIARASEGENVRRAGLERELAALQVTEDAMASALFSVRFRREQAELVDWRARLFEESGPLRDEALVWLPDSEPRAKAPKDVERLSKTERMRGAGSRAMAALALDPLDPDCAWVAAHTTDFIYGIVESRMWYDRFLALRGIRAHDHRTYADRKLDSREREALAAVQRALLGNDGSGGSIGGGR